MIGDRKPEMGESFIDVIDISPSPPEKERKVFHFTSSSLEDTGTPIKHILCLKNPYDIKRFEETEECFILDYDPFNTIDISNLSVSKSPKSDDGGGGGGTPDLAVLAEKGKVACRDYPHSRHLCLKFPFEKTSHESYCELCYCYVCDVPAPCSTWTEPKPAHCHALEQDGDWKFQRNMRKKQPQGFH
ncbi:RPM1 interacting protein 13-like [Humulus lupulus]|uniref:RPM1 interacting protein 13-like n=1 Tax=Humulus lupulus TaxID=3486 RepID=UPI002B4036EA|nr:RPM1 interacting protein 13-like [Humulus lupulus]